jgi:hypothetical protein
MERKPIVYRPMDSTHAGTSHVQLVIGGIGLWLRVFLVLCGLFFSHARAFAQRGAVRQSKQSQFHECRDVWADYIVARQSSHSCGLP